MSKHLLARIENNMPNFSKGQRLIAQYIEKYYDKAAYMTAYKLGSTVGVSESTVVRFAAEIGYDGYPKLQKAMQEMIRNKLTSLQRMEVASSRNENKDMLTSVLNQDIEKIRRTLEETSHESFNKAVDAIVGAEKIYIVAARSTSALALFLGFYFNLIFARVKVIDATSDNELYEQMFRISKKDIVIGISFPRYSKRAIKAMRFASDRGACVVAITDSMVSPLVHKADHVLLARSDMASIVDSLVAPLSLINALIAAIAVKKNDEVCEIFKNLEDIWEKYEVYEKIEENE